jgi:hypothetical protein
MKPQAQFIIPDWWDTVKPTKKGPLSFVLFESPFTSVSAVVMAHPSLVSLAIVDFIPQ